MNDGDEEEKGSGGDGCNEGDCEEGFLVNDGGERGDDKGWGNDGERVYGE